MNMNGTPHGNAQALRARLDAHPVYGMLRGVAELRCFMEHHIYSVWDFMSLVKSLQAAVAPVQVPWRPHGDPALRRFINSIVLEEESDLGDPAGESFSSHFELYCAAMREVGADPGRALRFVELVGRRGIETALAEGDVPEPSRTFMRSTFGFVNTGQPHLIAAALAHGREQVIPGMFRRVLEKLGVAEAQAPRFHFYLHRHIHLDEDFHAPLSLRLLDSLCAGDAVRLSSAQAAAQDAIVARLGFWDGVASAIEQVRAAGTQTSPGAAGS